MNLGVVGVTYRETPMECMERMHLSASRQMELYARIQGELDAECVILATCNRLEIYYAGGTAAIHAQMRALFLTLFPAAEKTMQQKQGREMLIHLFRVAGGLESLVLGEDQILGQIREAHDFARTQQESCKTINKIFLCAVTAAKKLKSELKISEIPLSIPYIGIRLLRQSCGVRGKTALVLGAGKMGRLAVKYLLEDGAEQITVCSRSQCEDQTDAQDSRVRVMPFADRYRLLSQADLVISATAAPHTVLDAPNFPSIRKPLWILDLGLPYDVQPAVRALSGVSLINMETLGAVSQQNAQRRTALAKAAQNLLAQEAEQCLLTLRRMKAEPVIVHLMDRCDTLTDEAMRFLTAGLTLTVRESAVIRRVIHSSLKKMVRDPIRALKLLDGDAVDGGVAAARTLFGLDNNGANKRVFVPKLAESRQEDAE